LAKRQARQDQRGKDRRPEQFPIFHEIPFIDRANHHRAKTFLHPQLPSSRKSSRRQLAFTSRGRLAAVPLSQREG
jgi:hypothetical protein